jgi:hypothetical protein
MVTSARWVVGCERAALGGAGTAAVTSAGALSVSVATSSGIETAPGTIVTAGTASASVATSSGIESGPGPTVAAGAASASVATSSGIVVAAASCAAVRPAESADLKTATSSITPWKKLPAPPSAAPMQNGSALLTIVEFVTLPVTSTPLSSIRNEVPASLTIVTSETAFSGILAVLVTSVATLLRRTMNRPSSESAKRTISDPEPKSTMHPPSPDASL